MKPISLGRTALLLSSLILFPAFAMSDPKNAPVSDEDFARIEALSGSIDSLVEGKSLQQHHFVNLGGGKRDLWKEYPSFEAAKNDCQGGCHQSALVFSRWEEPLLAQCFLSDPSETWALYLKFYFREDGSLAKLAVDLRQADCRSGNKKNAKTFMGQVFWEEYYRVDGTQAGWTEPRCFNRETQKPVKGMTGWEARKNHYPVYRKTSELPFVTAPKKTGL